MALSYKYVLPGGGYAENSIVKEMFDDVKAYVDTFVPSGGAAPVDAKYVTITTNATLSDERVLTGTANQIVITDNGAGSTVVLSLPQDIANTSTPSFAGIKLRNGSGNTVTINPKSSFSNYTLTMPADDGTSGQFLQTDGSGVLSWAAVTTGVTDIHGTTQQITVSATTGSVTLSLPQDIATNSAVQFNQMMLSGGTGPADLTLKLHDSNNGIYVDGATLFEIIVNSTIAAQWDFTTFQFWNTGPIQSGSFKFRDAAGSHPTVTIVPPTGFTSYSLTLPVDDGTPNQVLQTDGSGILSWVTQSGSGTVNTGTANRLAYYAASTAAVSALAAITASRALVSDANGLPTHATTTATEIGYVNGVTSAIQTQFTGKANTALSNLSSVAINTSLLPGGINTIDVGAADYIWRAVYGVTHSAGSNGVAGNVQIFPSTSSKGSIKITAVNNSGDTVTEITNAAQAGARTYTIPDAGASASFVMTEGTQTINGTKQFSANLGLGVSPSFDLHIEKSSAGGIDLYVKNTNTGSGAYAGLDLVSGGATGGDSYIYLTNQTNSWILGLDNSDSDRFVISSGASLGTNNMLVIDATNGVSIKGTATNVAAAAGYVGQIIEATVLSNTSVGTSGQYFDATSILLTPGNWLIFGHINYLSSGATITNPDLEVGVSTTSGNSGTGLSAGSNLALRYLADPVTFSQVSIPLPPGVQALVSTNTTYYLKGVFGSYSAGTPKYTCRITALRIS